MQLSCYKQYSYINKSRKVNSKILLLDFDGVILKNKNVSKIITNKINHYVMNKLNINYANAIAVNKILYKNYGHTLLGLKNVYGFYDSIHYFNDNIYDYSTYYNIKNYLNDNKTLEHAKKIRNLITSSKLDYYIFSNAPMDWIVYNLNLLNLADLFNSDNILSSDHQLFCYNNILKPQKKIYDIIDNNFKADRYIYIEDSFINLKPIIGNNKWYFYYYNINNPIDFINGEAIDDIDILSI